MQDPRYKKLRQNLDRMMYLQHLNPDSVDLVQKMLNQHTRLLQTFNKLKKKTGQQPKADTANYQHQIDLLNQKYGQIKQQNQRLKRQLTDNGIQQKIVTLQSALNTCRVKYQQKLDQLNDKVANYEHQIQQLTIAKTSLSDENQRIRTMLERSKGDHENTSVELTAILDKKKKEIVKLEEENSKLRMQIGSLERIYSQQKQSKSSLDGQSQKKSQLAIQMLKQQLHQSEQKLASTKSQLLQQSQTNRQLSNQIKTLKQTIQKLRSEQDHAKNSYHIESNAKSKYEQMYAESQGKLQELRERLQASEDARGELEAELGRVGDRVREVEGKNKMHTKNINNIQDQLIVLNTNLSNKIRENRQLQNQRAVLQRKIKDLQLQLEQHQSPGNRASNDPYSQNLAQQYQKKQAVLQRQIQITQNQLKIMQENQHAILTDKAKLETQVKKLQLIIGEGNKQIQIMQQSKENLVKENQELKGMLSSTQSQGYNNRSEALRFKEKIDQYEIMIQDLRIALRNQQNTTKQFAQKASQYEKAVQQQIMNNKQIFQDNKQLKLMVTSLQKTKADLFEKYKSTHEEKATREEDRIQYIKEYNKLLEENRALEDKLKKKQCALMDLSNQYDVLQNAVDDKTVENAGLLDKIRKLEKELTSYDRGIGEREMNLQGQQNVIKNLEREMQKLQRMYNIKCQQQNQSQILLNRYTLDIQQLNNQINLLVMNSKQHQKTNQNYKQRQIQLQRKLKDRINQVDQLRQVSSSTRIQNQALIQQIRRQKEQFQKLQNYCNKVVDEYNKNYHLLAENEVVERELREAVTQLQFKENQYANQIAHYERQLRSLGEEMIKKDQELRRLAEDRDVYRAQVNTSRRNYSSSTDWKIVYQQKIKTLQNQLSVKKRQCDSVKSQLRRYQKLIESERQKNFYLQQQIKKSKVNDSVQTPIKLFYKSQVQSQNWNGYNRQFGELQKRSLLNMQQHLEKEKQRQRQRHSKISRNSNNVLNSRSSSISESFQSQKVSLSSKECYQNLDQITRQYNATLNIKKINR